MTTLNWHESDLEKWLMAHSAPVLPGVGPILIVKKHRAIKRDVDLLAVDADGALVILEVKNKRGETRAAIGQSIEYLSQYRTRSITDLEREFEEQFHGSLREAFLKRFDRELTCIAPQRRVFIIAPSFDRFAELCVGYLKELLLPTQVTYGLICAVRCGDDFDLGMNRCPDYLPTVDLEGRCGLTPMERVYYVVRGGASPIVWNVGRLVKGQIKVPSSTKHSLRYRHEVLMPADSLNICDLSKTGTVWAKSANSGEQAKVIGIINPTPRASDSLVVLARFSGGQFEKFGRKRWVEFSQDWKQVQDSLPDWEMIVEAAQGNKSGAM